MPTVDWPSPATAGQTYDFDGNYWVYTSTGAWRKLTNAGQVTGIFIKLNDFVYNAGQDFAFNDDFVKLEYV